MWIFDQSSGHNGFASDALVASRMNVKPGGKQPIMHDTVKPNGDLQTMVDAHGGPKGLKRVLQERGVNVTRMVRKDMVKALSEFPDFKEEKSAVYTYLHRIMRYHCIVLPKVSIIVSTVCKNVDVK